MVKNKMYCVSQLQHRLGILLPQGQRVLARGTVPLVRLSLGLESSGVEEGHQICLIQTTGDNRSLHQANADGAQHPLPSLHPGSAGQCRFYPANFHKVVGFIARMKEEPHFLDKVINAGLSA